MKQSIITIIALLLAINVFGEDTDILINGESKWQPPEPKELSTHILINGKLSKCTVIDSDNLSCENEEELPKVTLVEVPEKQGEYKEANRQSDLWIAIGKMLTGKTLNSKIDKNIGQIVANIVGGYYNGLIKNGLTKDQAFKLLIRSVEQTDKIAKELINILEKN